MAAANSLQVEQGALQPATTPGPLRGVANLLDKELGLWWNTRKWRIHLLLWPLLLNGLALVAAFSLAKEPNFTAFEISQMITTLFFLTMGQAAAFGAVIVTQGAIVGEKQRGTAAWIMSKPVRREVFILAKVVAHAVSFLSLAVVIPSVIFYGQSLILWGSLPDSIRFAGGVLVVLLHVLCYLALSLMLGTLFRGSGPVAGIAVGCLLGGLVAQERVGKLVRVMPWELPDIAALFATGNPITRVTWPIVATVLWAVIFVVAALWRFRRDEF